VAKRHTGEHEHSHAAPEAAEHVHTHAHAHQQREGVVKRLKRAEGHLAAVRRMVEEGRDCPDILIQISAVRAALDATAKVVLADHVESCLQDAERNGDTEAAWLDLRRALESFIR
jgi:DNA-binding FrmR family transcriptional regulator